MKHASLFSGIGGAELAASWMGWDNLFHCEINPFGRKVLEYWFPKSKSYEDITKTDFREWRGKIDVLTGGFPCQPFSQAGKRKGDTDDRYLWPQMLRAIREIRPTWVVGENVAGIVSMVESCEEVEMGSADDIFEENIIYRKEQEFTIERICKDFEREGYSVQPIVIPACAVGAPHRRDRVWFISHRDNARDKGLQSWTKLSNEFETIADTECSRGGKVHNKAESEQSDGHGINCNGDERTVANTYGDRWGVRENEQKFIKGGERKTNNCVSSEDGIVTNTNVNGYSSQDKSKRIKKEKSKNVQQNKWKSEAKRNNGLSGFQQSFTDTNSDGFNKCNSQNEKQPNKRRLNALNDIKQNNFAKTDWRNFPTQSPICSRNDGISDRLDGITFPKWRAESIKAYGNAWVPQVAYEIFKAIESITQ